jgi:hypothetical protein
LCGREIAAGGQPRTIEERLTAATAALNNGAHDRAESPARGVLAEDPHQDPALYLLAVIEVRRSRAKGVVVSGKPRAESRGRAQARHEPDFERCSTCRPSGTNRTAARPLRLPPGRPSEPFLPLPPSLIMNGRATFTSSSSRPVKARA